MQSQCAWGPECSLIASFYLTTTWDEMSRNKQHEAIETDVNLLFLLYLVLWPRARVSHGPVAESSSYSPGTSYMHLIGRQSMEVAPTTQ